MNPADLKSFFHGKRVYVTGHTGFKGSWATLWLIRMGAKVGGYALPAEDGRQSLFDLLDLAPQMESATFGDIRDADALAADMTAFAPDILIHMAAQPLVRRSYREPIDTFATNVMGTAHVLDAARRIDSLRAIVSVTTDKCYENLEWVWPYRETDKLGGHDPYSASKACAEIVSAAYRSSFLAEQGKYLATGRAGNVIGGGDFSEDRIIPDFMRAIEADATLVMRAPNAIRPWQHVLDAVHGYFLLAEKLYTHGAAFAEAFNFSPEGQPPATVRALIDRLIQTTGRGSYQIDPSKRDVHEATFLRLDSSKSRARLGWEVLMPLDMCLDATARWYDVYLQKGSLWDISCQQIADFESLMHD